MNILPEQISYQNKYVTRINLCSPGTCEASRRKREHGEHRRRKQLAAPSSGGRQLLGATTSRCRDSLERALGTLKRGRESAATGAGDEILAIDLCEALDHLGRTKAPPALRAQAYTSAL